MNILKKSRSSDHIFPLFFITIYLFCTVFVSPVFAWQGVVTAVHDGDSVRVKSADGTVVPIRIYGIDCPEIGQPYGREARDLTAALLLGKAVEVVPAQKSKSYGRQVASILLPDGSAMLQEVLTASGLAWVDGRYCKQQVCDTWRQRQHEAKTANPPCGLWADPGSMPPWQWRRMKKGKN